MPNRFLPIALLAAMSPAAILPVAAQTPDQVLVVVNKQSSVSREIGAYYMQKRAVPAANLVTIDTEAIEQIKRPVYEAEIESPIGKFLTAHGLREKILYIVLTSGVPLKMWGEHGEGLNTDGSSVDSELTVLYAKLHGATIPTEGAFPNPFFGKRDTPFSHPLFPLYLVTRLDGYSMADMKALVDRSLAARNRGAFIVDLRADESTLGNQRLRNAVMLLPRGRVITDETIHLPQKQVLQDLKEVIGYASWGSNDPDRKHPFLHLQWLPGAIATEFVSTDGRTFRPPPILWDLGRWSDKNSWYAGAPQTLAADYIHEGASAASGQVMEPWLNYCPDPEFVLPAYYSGRTMAESFYMGVRGLSWMNVIIGDPLMRLK